jgi:hypothetical protein
LTIVDFEFWIFDLSHGISSSSIQKSKIQNQQSSIHPSSHVPLFPYSPLHITRRSKWQPTQPLLVSRDGYSTDGGVGDVVGVKA